MHFASGKSIYTIFIVQIQENLKLLCAHPRSSHMCNSAAECMIGHAMESHADSRWHNDRIYTTFLDYGVTGVTCNLCYAVQDYKSKPSPLSLISIT